jgi:hypothetical protein
MIPKSATKIGAIKWTKGARVDLWIGTNSNTGETIVWQQVQNRRASRVTGRNITKLRSELDHALNEGECSWAERDFRGVEAFYTIREKDAK